MKYHQITASMAKDIAFNLGAVLNDEEAGAFADGYNVAMLKVNKDMSTALSNNASLSTNSPVIPDGWGMVPATAPIVPEDLRRSFEAVARLNNEMYRWTSCMSYNGSYVGEPEGLLKRNIREIERILDRCKSDKGE